MIEVIEVRKYYGSSATGLEKESLTINKGEIVGIIGENGSGKTTLLKAIMGLCELNEGKVLIEGKPVEEMYGKMAYITCEGSYFPSMKPLEYGEFLLNTVPGFDMERYIKLLKYFELDVKQKIKNLSHGQKAKLEISAGFCKRAEYILMDEPFIGKDMFTRRDFLKLMISYLKDNETILIATHLVDEIENFVDRVVILRYGRIKADLLMDDIKENNRDLKSVLMEITGYREDKYRHLFTM
ncbi:MAG: ABC transporter ATP-binding protein [Clostridiaceae bacterium]|nr:ABC transporter ATP-binding protein [Clostridiaceae bacterium]